MRFHVSGGVGKVEMDGRPYKAVGSDALVESDGAAGATDIYAVEVVGGIGRVIIGRA